MAWFETLRDRWLATSSATCFAVLIACGGSSDEGGRSRTTDGGSGAAGKGGGGSAGAAGTSTGGASGSDGGRGDCGGLAGLVCKANEWCDYPNGSICGATDVTGTCRTRPSACDADCPGACGCDGKFYCNACHAQQAGVDVTGDRSCQADGGLNAACTSDSECSAGLKCCYPCGVEGCTNQCIAPLSDGTCPLFP